MKLATILLLGILGTAGCEAPDRNHDGHRGHDGCSAPTVQRLRQEPGAWTARARSVVSNWTTSW